MNKKVSVVLTSCNRFDLLERTLDSFFRFNTYPIEKFIVVEDGNADPPPEMVEKYPVITFMKTILKVGQVEAIDAAYANIDTEYIFHCEDDWEFYRPGFIEPSMDLLELYPHIICVWLRSLEDTNRHPIRPGGTNYKYLSITYQWKGFTWNPGLRRLEDYKKINRYRDHVSWNPARPWEAEKNIGFLYFRMGYKAAILNYGFVRHIGDGRHVNTTNGKAT